MGIWNECDDSGSFEWSPLKLKMRILPADNIDAKALLEQIEAAGGVMRYEVGGRHYGAVRNFCQFQRPKKPNSIHPQTAEVRAFVGTEARSMRDGSGPVDHQLPTGGEKARQMEDGGRKKKVVPLADANGGSDEGKTLFDEGVRLLVSKGRPEPQARSIIARFQKDFGDPAVLDAINRCRTATDPVSAMRDRLGRAKVQTEYMGP
jgi:hypothetical protein